jgi:serine/threonine protein kinase
LAGGGAIDDNIFEPHQAKGQYVAQSDSAVTKFQTAGVAKEDLDDCRESVLIGYRNEALSNVKYEDFKLVCLIGKGTFGKVFLSELAATGQQYAIKAIRKDVLIEYNQVKNTMLEKEILLQCKHPFLVGMEFLF